MRKPAPASPGTIRPVRALEAEDTLRERLRELGIGLTRRGPYTVGPGADARRAVDVFFAYAAELIDEPDHAYGETISVNRFEDGDLLLFETGTSGVLPPAERPQWRLSDEPVPQAYVMTFTRQFTFADPAGEYHGMNSVTLALQWEPSPELERLPEAQIWGTAGPEWTREELLGHGHPVDPPPPTGAAAWQQEVAASVAFSRAWSFAPTLFYIMQSDV